MNEDHERYDPVRPSVFLFAVVASASDGRGKLGCSSLFRRGVRRWVFLLRPTGACLYIHEYMNIVIFCIEIS